VEKGHLEGAAAMSGVQKSSLKKTEGKYFVNGIC
jgi:hypothetical protein